MDQEVMREYARLRSKQWSAREALSAAKVNVSFATFEREGYARLRVEADDDIDLSFLDDRDVFEESEANKERARCSREGVHGIITEALNPLSGEWTVVDSCWGFIGDDWKDSGYDTDGKAEAIEWLESFVHHEVS